MSHKLTAGPTPDGTFISRRTDNDYAFAVAVWDTSVDVWDRKAGYNAYKPNPTYLTWVSGSWHGTYALALRSAERFRRQGHRTAIVPVVREQ